MGMKHKIPVNIPEHIKKFVDMTECEFDSVGMSGASVIIFSDKVLKIEPVSEESEHEAEIMKQMHGKIPVPRVWHHENSGGMSYLLMSKVRGVMSCSEYYMQRPDELADILAAGLKQLWAADISECSYICGIDRKLKTAEYNVGHGLVDMENTQPETFGEGGFKDPEDLLEWLKNNKPDEEYVLSHGDFCLPNIFINEGKINGYIDLGKMGLADRYMDIAICYRSLKNNFNGLYGVTKHEGFRSETLFEKLGIEPDWDKIKYYILLDELF